MPCVTDVNIVKVSIPKIPLRRRVQVDCSAGGMTKQSFKDITDINNIVAKYRSTGLIEYVNENPGVFEDVSDIKTYHEALNMVEEAQNNFRALPSALRERFGNDPGRLLEFLADGKNREEAEKLGLVTSRVKSSSSQTQNKAEKNEINDNGPASA